MNSNTNDSVRRPRLVVSKFRFTSKYCEGNLGALLSTLEAVISASYYLAAILKAI
jgi:hypothetical protein